MAKTSGTIVLSKNVVLLFFIIMVLSVFLGTLVFHKLQHLSRTSNPSTTEFTSKVVNYDSFQLKIPPDYFVTDRHLFTYFQSQGGAGWPDLVLLKGTQFLNPYQTESQAFEELYKSGNDCILVTSNPITAIPGIDGEEDGTNDIYVVAAKSETIGKYPVATRMISSIGDKESTVENQRFDAIIDLEQGKRIYFETCNTNNETDLYTVLKSFQLREENFAQ